MTRNRPFILASVAAQSLGLCAAIALAVFAPQPGRASALIPISPISSQDAARMASHWVASEDGQWLAFDHRRGQATVIAPSALSLARALAYGFVPIASDISTCTAAKDGQPIESTIA